MYEKSQPVFSLSHVSYRYDAKAPLVLADVSLHVQPGEIVVILGPSGSGKSTIFRLLSQLDSPEQGSVTSPEKVGFMPQDDLLLPWRRVIEQAMLPLEIQGFKRKDARRLVEDRLQTFGLEETADKYPKELSGGMKQRVSLLRAAMAGQNTLLLDEPFSKLDALTRVSMQEWLLQIWEEESLTILFITHDLDEALLLADRVLLFTEMPLMTPIETVVPLGRPRNAEDITKPEAQAVKRDWLQRLKHGRERTIAASD
ncbi:ABC transporter ATP-binding protein [Salsuginibacillus halophilus]|nr:ATP-binding cassette domain-containing protein [Salsuginibacillus halophilus]